ncbi:putative protein-serine/threonine phosphatase [Helianthus annuus]|nr:putative protein-serine/threonine phosphatase [Helianthus annuus]
MIQDMLGNECYVGPYKPKWNDALLEAFRIDYVGKSPYINCLASLYHHF